MPKVEFFSGIRLQGLRLIFRTRQDYRPSPRCNILLVLTGGYRSTRNAAVETG